jgi:hypothetical protein
MDLRACGIGTRTVDVEDGALTDLHARTEGM